MVCLVKLYYGIFYLLKLNKGINKSFIVPEIFRRLFKKFSDHVLQNSFVFTFAARLGFKLHRMMRPVKLPGGIAFGLPANRGFKGDTGGFQSSGKSPNPLCQRGLEKHLARGTTATLCSSAGQRQRSLSSVQQNPNA